MPTRSHASIGFFVGFLVLGTLLSGVLIYGFDQYDARWPKAMSFGVGLQVVSVGALVSAVGYFVGLRCFHVVVSQKQSVLSGGIFCGLLFCLLAGLLALGLRGPADTQTYGLFLSLVIFLGGFALVPLSKKIFQRTIADVERG